MYSVFMRTYVYVDILVSNEKLKAFLCEPSREYSRKGDSGGREKEKEEGEGGAAKMEREEPGGPTIGIGSHCCGPRKEAFSPGSWGFRSFGVVEAGAVGSGVGCRALPNKTCIVRGEADSLARPPADDASKASPPFFSISAFSAQEKTR
jgi:hypothetical protein